MAQIEERKRFWQVFYSPLVFIILLVVFLLLARAVWRVYTHEKISERDRARMETDLAENRQREVDLKEKVSALQTQKGVEDEIRSKFNVAKAGEGVAMIVDSASTTGTTSTSTVDKSWWKKFTSFFAE